MKRSRRAAPGRPPSSSTAASGRRARPTARPRRPRVSRRRRTAPARAGRRRTRSRPGAPSARGSRAPASSRRRVSGWRSAVSRVRSLHAPSGQKGRRCAGHHRHPRRAGALHGGGGAYSEHGAHVREDAVSCHVIPIRTASTTNLISGLDFARLLTEDHQNPSAARQNLRGGQVPGEPFSTGSNRRGRGK